MYKKFSQNYNYDLKEKYPSSQFNFIITLDSFSTKRNIFLPADESFSSITKTKHIELEQDLHPQEKSF